MVAVPEMYVSAPAVVTEAGRSAVPAAPAHSRRAVAVAVSAMELLRPESDLARLLARFPHVDLLVAATDEVAAPGTLGVLGADLRSTDDPDDPDDLDDDDRDEVREGVDRLGIAGLHLHRLGLRAPLGGMAEDDLVAAMSELVGFDPEPGVFCLAPGQSAGDPSRAMVNRAAQRIAQVYGIPLLRYRCLELSVVGDLPS